MDFEYKQVTAKHVVDQQNRLFNDLSRDHLLKLLIYLEGEVEAREHVINLLKEERVNLLLFEAQYARLCPANPYRALSRDSNLVKNRKNFSIQEIYSDQLKQLDNLTFVNKEALEESYNLLVFAEEQHEKTLRELEKQNKTASNVNDLTMLWNEEREALTQKLDSQMSEMERYRMELENAQKTIEDEREKHKKIVLFLVKENERMLQHIKDTKQDGPVVPEGEFAHFADELHREMEILRNERDSLKNANRTLKAEVANLKEMTKSREEDLLLLRRNNLRPPEKLPEERSLVVANKAAMGGPSRLSSSSSFPSEKSRLPRAPSSPSRPSTSTLPKKSPAMGISTVRRAIPRLPPPEFGSLDAAVETISEKRSSLARGKSEPRHVAIEQKAPPSDAKPPPISRIVNKTDKIIPVTSKSRNSLLRAFGKS